MVAAFTKNSIAMVLLLLGLTSAGNGLGQHAPQETHVYDFTAVPTRDGAMLLRWRVSPADAAVGFLLLRNSADRGKSVSLTDAPLPAVPLQKDLPIFSYTDVFSGKTNSEISYTITVIDRTGHQATHGPFPVSDSLPPASTALATSHSAETTPLSVGSPGDKIKITISEPGLYQLSAADIADSLLAFSEGDIQTLIQATGQVMTCQDQQVPWRGWPDDAGLDFYAIPTNNTYTAQNVYWLEPGNGTATSVTSNAPTGPVNDLFYQSHDHWEENLTPLPGIYTDPEADMWCWKVIYSWVGSLDDALFFFDLDHAKTNALGQASGNISVGLQGFNKATAGSLRHTAEISVNGTVYSSNSWFDITATNIQIAATNLVEGTNTLRVQGYNVNASGYSIFVVDAFDVEYDRHYVAADNALAFSSSSNAAVTVTGFSSNEITVLDVTDPGNPLIVEGATIDQQTGGTYRVTFAPSSSDRSYYAACRPLASPPSTQGRILPDLRSTTNAAVHVTIAATGFDTAAAELVNLRSSQGLSTILVGIEDIYDTFSHGLKDPVAVKAFLSTALADWSTPPRFVVLAGSGSYDYKNYLGFNDSLIPPPMVYVPQYGLRASDAPLADLSGNKAPELALGRLHCQTAPELAGVIAKIQAFERDAEWKSRAHFAADKYDPAAGDFSASSSDTAVFVPTNQYTVIPNYLDTQTVNEVNGRLMDAFNSGSYIISYFGHGNPDQLSDDQILKLSHLNSLTNAVTPPVMSAMTCDFVYFGYPGSERLGEGLLGRAHGGVSAIWGSAAPTYNFASEELAAYFFEAVFQDRTIRLGDAITNALAQYESDGTWPTVLDVMCLLGDPAMAMPPPGYSFGSWQSIFFTPEQLADPQISGPQADPDGDGIVNLSEFSNNGNPTNATPITEFEAWVEAVDIGGGLSNDFVTASFQQRQLREGVESFIEASTNLSTQSWSSGPGVTHQLSVTPVDEVMEEVLVRITPALTTNRNHRFVRMRIVLDD